MTGNIDAMWQLINLLQQQVEQLTQDVNKSLETIYVEEHVENQVCCPTGWIRSGCNGDDKDDVNPSGALCCDSTGTDVYAICLRYV